MRRVLLGAAAIMFVFYVPLFANECDADAADAKVDEAARALSNPTKMAQLAQEAIDLCSTSARAHNALGTALESLGREDEAVSEYELAWDLAPDWCYPPMGLGDIARRRGDREKAERYFRKALSLAANNYEREMARAAIEEATALGGRSHYRKSAGTITKDLRIGQDAIRPRALMYHSEGGDYSAGSGGYAIALPVQFDVGSAVLLSEGRCQLNELSRALRQARTSERYVIEGHASTEGPEDQNLLLSQKRANRVRDFLIESGVPGTILEAVGKGERQPIEENGVENRTKSRRVVVVRPYD